MFTVLHTSVQNMYIFNMGGKKIRKIMSASKCMSVKQYICYNVDDDDGDDDEDKDFL